MSLSTPTAPAKRPCSPSSGDTDARTTTSPKWTFIACGWPVRSTSSYRSHTSPHETSASRPLPVMPSACRPGCA